MRSPNVIASIHDLFRHIQRDVFQFNWDLNVFYVYIIHTHES